MGSATSVSDFGSQYRDYERGARKYRPAVASTVYSPGIALQFSSQDIQPYPDQKGVGLPGTGANQQSIVGIVSETWVGFGGSVSPANYTSGANLTAGLVRGTQYIDAVISGFHPSVLVDQSGAGAVTIVDKLPLIASRGTAGYLQGGSVSAPNGISAFAGNASLPASGIGSSITAAALAAASQTDTIAGAPAAGDTLSVTIQTPYVPSAPGTAQTTTWTTPPLTSAQAVSATTAAAALVAYLNAQPSFSAFFTAANAAGVVTVTVNNFSVTSPMFFKVNFGSGSTEASFFTISLSGMVANSLTFAVAATGGSTATAGGANLAGGTGFKGYLPALVGCVGC
jgi:hypothetical protein